MGGDQGRERERENRGNPKRQTADKTAIGLKTCSSQMTWEDSAGSVFKGFCDRCYRGTPATASVSKKAMFPRCSSEPLWPSGKAGKQKTLGSNLLRLSFLFKSCGLWTLSCDFVPHN